MVSDAKLINRIRKRQDRQAAGDLIERYYDEIFRFAFRQVGEKEQALDMTQEIFILMLKMLPRYDEQKASFRTWLYRLAENKMIDHFRSRYSRQISMEEPLDNEVMENSLQALTVQREIASMIADRELLKNVMKYIMRYENQWVRLFQMKLFEDRTFDEIGAELDMSVSTVKTRYYSMLNSIRKDMKDYYE